jgi:hypothetical protein
MKWDRKVPFTSTDKSRKGGVPGGSLLEYADSYVERFYGIEWRDNCVFEATLVYTGYERGRSAARLLFDVCEAGVDGRRRVHMFMTDFDQAVRERGFTTLDGRGMVGRWTYCKRGRNFGCKMAKEPK